MSKPGPRPKPSALVPDKQDEVQYDEITEKTIRQIISQSKTFDEIVKILCKAGVATIADTMSLSILKDTWEDYQEAQVKCVEEGKYQYTTTGYAQQTPWSTQVNKLREQIFKILKEFGLTPSSRVGLRPDSSRPQKVQDDNPLDI